MIVTYFFLVYCFLGISIYAMLHENIFRFLKKKLGENLNNALIKIEDTLNSIVGLILYLGIPFILIMHIWVLPNVYVINDCNSYSKKILLLPKTYDGVNLKLGGEHCYLLNNSNSKIQIRTLIYDLSFREYGKLLRANIEGKTTQNQKYANLSYSTRNKIINKVIHPRQILEVKEERVEYIFETPPTSSKELLQFHVQCD